MSKLSTNSISMRNNEIGSATRLWFKQADGTVIVLNNVPVGLQSLNDLLSMSYKALLIDVSNFDYGVNNDFIVPAEVENKLFSLLVQPLMENGTPVSLSEFIKRLLAINARKEQVLQSGNKISAVWRPYHLNLFQPYALFRAIYASLPEYAHTSNYELPDFLKFLENSHSVDDLKLALNLLEETDSIKCKTFMNNVFQEGDIVKVNDDNKTLSWHSTHLSGNNTISVEQRFSNYGIQIKQNPEAFHSNSSNNIILTTNNQNEAVKRVVMLMSNDFKNKKMTPITSYWVNWIGVSNNCNIKQLNEITDVFGLKSHKLDKHLNQSGLDANYLLIEAMPLRNMTDLSRVLTISTDNCMSLLSLQESEERFKKCASICLNNPKNINKNGKKIFALAYKVGVGSPSFFEQSNQQQQLDFFNHIFQLLVERHDNNMDNVIAQQIILDNDGNHPYMIAVFSIMKKDENGNEEPNIVHYFYNNYRFNYIQREIVEKVALTYGLLTFDDEFNKPFEKYANMVANSMKKQNKFMLTSLNVSNLTKMETIERNQNPIDELEQLHQKVALLESENQTLRQANHDLQIQNKELEQINANVPIHEMETIEHEFNHDLHLCYVLHPRPVKVLGVKANASEARSQPQPQQEQEQEQGHVATIKQTTSTNHKANSWKNVFKNPTQQMIVAKRLSIQMLR